MFFIVYLNSGGMGRSNMPSPPKCAQFHCFLVRLQKLRAILVYLKAVHIYQYIDRSSRCYWMAKDLAPRTKYQTLQWFYGVRSPVKTNIDRPQSNSPPTNPTYSALFPTKSFPVLPPSFVVPHPPKSLPKNTASKLTESATQLTQQLFLSLHLEQSIQ